MYKLFADSEGEMTTEQLEQANKSTEMYRAFQVVEPKNKRDTKRENRRPMTIRKKPKKTTEHKQKKKEQLHRKLIFGRTLSPASVRNILQFARGIGCNTLFDVGAGYGRIIKIAREEGFEHVAGVESETPTKLQHIPNVFDGTTFAQFVQNCDWTREPTQKTLFYVYEGGIWSEDVCGEAMAVIRKVAVAQDIVCIIAPEPSVSISIYDDNWDWKSALSVCHPMEKVITVSGDVCDDGQVETQLARFWTVTTDHLEDGEQQDAKVSTRLTDGGSSKK